MAPPEPPSEITVRVKVPQGHIEGTNRDEFQLGTISISQPISSLRQRIQTLVPSNPEPAIQRILFGGRALVDDNQSLADAFNVRRDPTQNEYVIHLLIRGGVARVSAAAHTHHANALPDSAGAGQGLFGQPTRVGGISQTGGMVSGHIGHGGQVGQGLFGTPQAGMQTGVGSGRPDGLVDPPSLFEATGGLFSAAAPLMQPLQAGSMPIDRTNATQSAAPGIQTTINGQPAQSHHHHHHHPGPHHHIHPAHPHAHPNQFGRPLSAGFHMAGTGADGHRFTYTTQTFVNGQPVQGQAPTMPMHPGMQLPVPHMPLGVQLPMPNMPPGTYLPMPTMPPGIQLAMPNMPLGMPFPGMPQPPVAQAATVSALERARENMAEMRRMLAMMRSENATEQTRAQLADLEQRMQAVNNYIDPFNFGAVVPRAASQQDGPLPEQAFPTSRHSPRIPGPFVGAIANTVSHMRPNDQPDRDLLHVSPQRAPSPNMQAPQARMPAGFGLFGAPQMYRPPELAVPQFGHTAPQSTQPTSLFLLSSPQGPHALLYSPQYGTYVGPDPYTNIQQQTEQLVPTPTQPAIEAPPAQPAAVVPAAQVQVAPLADQNLQPWLGHFWLLVRVGIFAYIFLGADMGWRRPVALALIGLGFWLIRLGLFGEGGLVRRWWEGLTHVQRQDGAANAQAPDGHRPLPTPEELAQRLIREQRERTPMHRLREQLRPAERALALFIASLWPGIGERYVQTLDRAREEQEAAQRAIEAERVAEGARLEAAAAEQSEKQGIEGEESKQDGEQSKVEEAPEVAGPVQATSSE